MTAGLVPLLNPTAAIPAKDPDNGIDPIAVAPIPDPSPVDFVETLRSNTSQIVVGPNGQTQGDLTLTLNIAGGGPSFPKNWMEVAPPASGTYGGTPYTYAGSGYVNLNPGTPKDFWNPTLTQNWYFFPRWYWNDGDGDPSYNYMYLPKIEYTYDSSYGPGFFDIPDGYTFNLVYIQQAGIPRTSIPTVQYLYGDYDYHIVAYQSRGSPTVLTQWADGLREMTIWPVTVAKSGLRDIMVENPLGFTAGTNRYTMYIGPPTAYTNKPSSAFSTRKHNNLPWYFNNEAFV